ncbi:hypothetical protein GGR21_002965 [Dysgonomonas hofstadii]|uniref:DUF1735 domain-containing protein n=1 Tax=Dysgonomonas hofstadii TaxID=637886 RepID=A0A840CPR6_9BACT|nr:hypothetical protein [Dysgonomonas hofstadii]MBB4037051.1 hypothetical protein [Dysgonomonas hofstadii]
MKALSTIFIILLLLWGVSCSDDDYAVYTYDDPTIYSSSNKVLLTEVILFLSPYIEDAGQKKYIVADNLSNLFLTVNKRGWQPAGSYQIDTLNLKQKETVGNYRVTVQKLLYPFAVNIRVSSEGISTAGEYSDLLNNYLNLQPGSYICNIESFDIKLADGRSKTVYTPNLICPLEVKENYASANLGEFEVLVD